MNRPTQDVVSAEYAIDDKYSMVTVRANDKVSTYLKPEKGRMISPKKY